jgi:hypothetical protein
MFRLLDIMFIFALKICDLFRPHRVQKRSAGKMFGTDFLRAFPDFFIA